MFVSVRQGMWKKGCAVKRWLFLRLIELIDSLTRLLKECSCLALRNIKINFKITRNPQKCFTGDVF